MTEFFYQHPIVCVMAFGTVLWFLCDTWWYNRKQRTLAQDEIDSLLCKKLAIIEDKLDDLLGDDEAEDADRLVPECLFVSTDYPCSSTSQTGKPTEYFYICSTRPPTVKTGRTARYRWDGTI